MTLKQVEPVECGEMRARTINDLVIAECPGMGMYLSLDEPEARALLEWLTRVCEPSSAGDKPCGD
jgi:hypothetical protein